MINSLLRRHLTAFFLLCIFGFAQAFPACAEQPLFSDEDFIAPSEDLPEAPPTSQPDDSDPPPDLPPSMPPTSPPSTEPEKDSETLPSDETATTPTKIVTSLQNEQALAALPSITLPLRSTSSDNNFEAVYRTALQYRTVNATVTSNGVSTQETLSVSWDFSAIDQTTAGQYSAIGSIILPDGYAFGNNVLHMLQIPVVVEAGPPAVITSLSTWHPFTDAQAFLQGTSLDAITKTLNFSPHYLQCYSDDGNAYTATIQWDLSGVDVNTVGLYYAIGTLSPPPDTVFADNLLLPTLTLPISIQALHKPDINCFFVGKGALLFPWVTPPGNIDTIHVLLSENNGCWQPLDESIYVGADRLLLFTSALTLGNHYRLQVDYEGGQTGILSFFYSEEIIIEGYREGDRDGGDIDGTSPDDIIQAPPVDTDDTETDTPPLRPPTDSDFEDSTPSPDDQTEDSEVPPAPPLTPPSTPEPSPLPLNPPSPPSTPLETLLFPPVSLPTTTTSQGAVQPPMVSSTGATATSTTGLEMFTQTFDRLSGTRFLLMLQAGHGNATFSKEGFTVIVPESTLTTAIQNDDWITVTIKQIAEDRFLFLFFINDVPVETLPGTLVIFPYNDPSALNDLSLVDENEHHFSMTSYNAHTGTVTFEISHPGTYRLSHSNNLSAPFSDTTHPAEKKPPMYPLILIGECLLLILIGGFFWRRRR